MSKTHATINDITVTVGPYTLAVSKTLRLAAREPPRQSFLGASYYPPSQGRG